MEHLNNLMPEYDPVNLYVFFSLREFKVGEVYSTTNEISNSISLEIYGINAALLKLSSN